MNAELADLGTKFSQNVLAEVNDSAVVADSKDQEMMKITYTRKK